MPRRPFVRAAAALFAAARNAGGRQSPPLWTPPGSRRALNAGIRPAFNREQAYRSPQRRDRYGYIGGSFVAAGFTAWGLLQIKELAMSIADWINDRRAKDRAKLIAQGYDQGYADARSGRPRRIAATPGDQPGPAAPPPLRPRRRRTLRSRP